MTQWQARFHDAMKYLRSKGWRHVFLMRGQKLYAIGMASPRQLQCLHHNNNQGRA